jgi:hypothetical protein
MDVDFFKNWELTDSVRIGGKLMGRIAETKSMLSKRTTIDVFPPGHPDEGSEVERLNFESIRYSLAADLGQLLSLQCAAYERRKDKEDKEAAASDDTPADIALLLKFLTLVLTPSVTHFAVG